MKKKKIKNRKNIYVFVIVLVFFLFILSLAVKNTSKTQEENTIFSKDIKETLESLDCEYISESESKKDGYDIDIYLKFSHDLFENNQSMESYFRNIVNSIANVSGHKNYRLIDEKRDILIEVKCDSVNQTITNIYINGESNYYSKINSKKNIKTNNEVITDFSIQSPEIINLINNGWVNNSNNYGTKKSTYKNYDIYFDEGIKVRNISHKTFNIIFDKKYKNSVVNDITVDMCLEQIVSRLGKPTYGSIDLGLIGYKGKNLYIFFRDGEISIYQRELYDYTEFNQYLTKYLENKDILEFMDKLTDLWPDYDLYNYDTDYLNIKYTLKGINIEFNMSDSNGIKLYTNYFDNMNDQNIIDTFINSDLVFIKDTNLVFNTELERINSINEDKENIEKIDKSNSEKGNPISNKYGINPKYNNLNEIIKIYFVSKNESIPDAELDDFISTYIWINDDLLVYSKKNKGLYYYNVTTKEKGELISGDDEFNIIEYKNGILKYDDKSVIIR